MSIVLLVSLLCLYCTNVYTISPHMAMIFLNRYGYLNLSKPTYTYFSNSLIFDRRYTDAIKKFQRYYQLPVTGRMSPEVERLMNTKRCGNPDFMSESDPFLIKIRSNESKYGLKRVKRYFIDDPRMRWMKKDITWNVNSYPTNGPGPGAVKAIFTKAFNMWSEVADINYSYIDDIAKADIIIEFKSGEHGDSLPFDGPNSVLGHAFYPIGSQSFKFSRAGDAHFDDDEIWVDGDQRKGRNLLSVAVHELGHSMGLGHSASENAIMYAFYMKPDKGQIKLNIDDKNGMQAIYGPAHEGKRLPPIPDVPNDDAKYIPPTIITVPPDTTEKIDICNTIIDAAIIIREVEIYIFSGKYMWRVDFFKTVTSWISYELRDEPSLISSNWPGLPRDIDHIDGGIERTDQKIYMFKDDKFWLLVDNAILAAGVHSDGLPLTEIGLPNYLRKIDAVFRWGYNNAIYIMAGHQYWKIDEGRGNFGYIYPRYPRSISSVWKHLPFPIDMAFTDLHKNTYFMKNQIQYEFNSLEMRVEYEEPLRAPWIGCKKF